MAHIQSLCACAKGKMITCSSVIVVVCLSIGTKNASSQDPSCSISAKYLISYYLVGVT